MPDTSGILSSLSRKRLANATRLLAGYYRSRITGNTEMSGMPFSMSVEPTTACNLGCTECPSGLRQFTRPTGNLDPDLLARVIDEVGEYLAYLSLYFQGEPFIHKQFPDLVSLASSRGIYTSTSTNGHFLSDENSEAIVRSGLNRLIISVDGTDQDTYEKYRINGDLKTVLSGIKTLETMKVKMRSRRPFTEMQFIVFSHNQHQMKEMRRLAASLGVGRLVFKTAQIYGNSDPGQLLPAEPYSRYRRNDLGKLEIKNRLLSHCWRMWQGSMVTWDGKVVPCCFDKDASHVLGDLGIQSFRDIWFGDRYRDFRNQLFRSRSEIDICTNCTEGTKVWI